MQRKTTRIEAVWELHCTLWGRGGEEEADELIKPCAVYLLCLPPGIACSGQRTAALRSPAYIQTPDLFPSGSSEGSAAIKALSGSAGQLKTWVILGLVCVSRLTVAKWVRQTCHGSMSPEEENGCHSQKYKTSETKRNHHNNKKQPNNNKLVSCDSKFVYVHNY